MQASDVNPAGEEQSGASARTIGQKCKQDVIGPDVSVLATSGLGHGTIEDCCYVGAGGGCQGIRRQGWRRSTGPEPPERP